MATSRGDAASPIRRLFISIASTTATTPSKTPIAIEPAASKRGSPVQIARPMPSAAIAKPVSAARSSSNTTGSSGLLVWRMNATHDSPRRTRFASRCAVRNEPVSSASETASTISAQTGLSSSSGLRNLSMPSATANSAPIENKTSATTNAQK